VIMGDAAVQRVDRFARGESVEFNLVGLGGTDFRPAFDYVEAEQLNPACLIYLTDGEGVFPDEPSDYPTLWAITSPGMTAPWGETVTIHETAD
jgi:predicted metal-dependent peptidase